MIIDEISYLARQHGKFTDKPPKPKEEQIVNGEHLGELESLAIEKIREARDQHRLIDTPDLPHVLWRWRDWEGEATVRSWVDSAVASDPGLATFLGQFLQKGFSHGWSDRVAKTHYKLDPKSLEPFISPDSIIDRAKTLKNHANPNDWERNAIDSFLQGYEARQAGKDPSNMFDD